MKHVLAEDTEVFGFLIDDKEAGLMGDGSYGYSWVSSRGGEGLKVRPVEIAGKVSNILVQSFCWDDKFERTLEGRAFVCMVTITFVIGAIRLPRRGRLVMPMVAGSNVWYIFSTALPDSVSAGRCSPSQSLTGRGCLDEWRVELEESSVG
ncbi:hypothetical protein GIB67_007450 [Kingdonia uniflora]|uniref:Uncharacterized protein n=1 Tax=Kingdonia uniflora TaxID=39325 RepID=A0A7J7P3Q0_9MAGN|nr:hypothetical protein GIB67_007450 [Kingdonia uniflora]